MSTRSRIAIEHKCGSIDSIYCHSDGYPSYMVDMLRKNYNTPEKVQALINLGSLSVLGETPERCFAYHRDRNEDLVIHNSNNIIDLLDYFFAPMNDQEYLYVFNTLTNKWYYITDQWK